MKTDGLIKSIDALLSLDARGALVPHGIGDLARELLEKCAEALTQPAEQHQGEPVELPARKPWNGLLATADNLRGEGWNACLDEIAKMGPLYTHADPSEVRVTKQALESLKGEANDLRAQLAERDALLREASGKLIVLAARIIDEPLRALRNDLDSDGPVTRIKVTDGVDQAGNSLGGLSVAIRRVVDALSASAEPSAPLAWHVGGNGYDRICFEKPANLPGHPCIQAIHDQRQLIDLLKRYNLCNEDAGEPVELDALTDLATWKRRAIEAESKLRTYDPQVVELGEQAMQALLAQPKPNELVLTKCRLCDQLQADLTARDQRIDLLEHQVQLADHWLEFASFNSVGEPVEHTQEMRDKFRQQMIAAVFPDYVEASTHGRLNGIPKQPCTGCGTPGWTGACNKCVPY